MLCRPGQLAQELVPHQGASLIKSSGQLPRLKLIRSQKLETSIFRTSCTSATILKCLDGLPTHHRKDLTQHLPNGYAQKVSHSMMTGSSSKSISVCGGEGQLKLVNKPRQGGDTNNPPTHIFPYSNPPNPPFFFPNLPPPHHQPPRPHRQLPQRDEGRGGRGALRLRVQPAGAPQRWPRPGGATGGGLRGSRVEDQLGGKQRFCWRKMGEYDKIWGYLCFLRLCSHEFCRFGLEPFYLKLDFWGEAKASSFAMIWSFLQNVKVSKFLPGPHCFGFGSDF